MKEVNRCPKCRKAFPLKVLKCPYCKVGLKKAYVLRIRREG